MKRNELEERLNSAKFPSFKNMLNDVTEGDTIEEMKKIPDNTVDMVLVDLPYGTTQNKWDSVIPLDELWKQYHRIVKKNGAMIFTASGLFTAELMLSNPREYKYNYTWIKSKATNFLNAKRQPLRKHEDILVFYRKQPTYNPQMTKGEAYSKGVRKDQVTGSYGDFNPVLVKSKGMRYPVDVLYFKTAESEGKVVHPTQKPVALGRYLIRTFSNPGDVVLDNTSGSGSFLVSALLEGRNFIGIEKNKDVSLFKKKTVDYIKITRDRIREGISQMKETDPELLMHLKKINLLSNEEILDDKAK
ncbi:MAG: site-specific DNA-methyltransferase [Lactobacillus sp.]|nr:site-specific DNA-methyltransferase [Lactobacillus sp.]